MKFFVTTVNIINYHGPQFISKFWKHLFRMLKVSCKLSSCYHPQLMDTKRTNQPLEQYFCYFISYQQDDCVDILHFVGFSYNNSINSSTRVTPFYAYTGYHPRWCLVEPLELPTNPSAQDHLEWLRQIHAKLSNHLHEAHIT